MEIRIDKSLVVSVLDQLTGQLILLIRSGDLRLGEQLPTIKELADTLKLNYNTVAAAYRTLEQKGYVTQNRRAGTRVATKLPEDLATELLAHVTAVMARQLRTLRAEPNEITKMLTANLALNGHKRPINVAVLARTPLEAAQAASRTQAILGDSYMCAPQTPAEYQSVDYHLNVVDPKLITSFAKASFPKIAFIPDAEIYSAAFPAGAD